MQRVQRWGWGFSSQLVACQEVVEATGRGTWKQVPGLCPDSVPCAVPLPLLPRGEALCSTAPSAMTLLSWSPTTVHWDL